MSTAKQREIWRKASHRYADRHPEKIKEKTWDHVKSGAAKEATERFKKRWPERVREYSVRHNEKLKLRRRERGLKRNPPGLGPDKERAHAGHLKRKFGITMEEYQRMLYEQKGVCAICRKPPTKKRLAVDHDHNTGRIRGLLHTQCNAAIGILKDDPAVMYAAAVYLENPLWQ